jgi:hypothetical protein
MFIEATLDGSLSQTVSPNFWANHWNQPIPANLWSTRVQPQIKQNNFKPAGKTLNNMVFQALGSRANRAEFVLCEKSINSFKERVWSLSSPMEDNGFKTYVEDGVKGAIENTKWLSGIRTVGHAPLAHLFCITDVPKDLGCL